jgi:hypothetical protein
MLDMLKGLRSDSRVDVGICSVIDFDWESRGVVWHCEVTQRPSSALVDVRFSAWTVVHEIEATEGECCVWSSPDWLRLALLEFPKEEIPYSGLFQAARQVRDIFSNVSIIFPSAKYFLSRKANYNSLYLSLRRYCFLMYGHQSNFASNLTLTLPFGPVLAANESQQGQLFCKSNICNWWNDL